MDKHKSPATCFTLRTLARKKSIDLWRTIVGFMAVEFNKRGHVEKPFSRNFSMALRSRTAEELILRSKPIRSHRVHDSEFEGKEGMIIGQIGNDNQP